MLIREIFGGWALLSLTDVLSEPYALNTLIALATGSETMAPLPTTPNYKVRGHSKTSGNVYVQRS